MEVLDYHKLKIFKTVADTKSFSKAAELLFLSQPTVTLQIKKIEKVFIIVNIDMKDLHIKEIMFFSKKLTKSKIIKP